MKKRVPSYHQTTFDLTVFPIPQNSPFRSFSSHFLFFVRGVHPAPVLLMAFDYPHKLVFICRPRFRETFFFFAKKRHCNPAKVLGKFQRWRVFHNNKKHQDYEKQDYNTSKLLIWNSYLNLSCYIILRKNNIGNKSRCEHMAWKMCSYR